jgi:hypothetical protein
MKSKLESDAWSSKMNNQDTMDSRSKQWRSWLVLFSRWLLGGFIGFGLSAWICFGYITNTITGPLLWVVDFLPIITFLFSGPLLLFDPSFFGNKDLIDSLVRSFPYVDYDFLVISLPSIIWGFIGALLASGRKNQLKLGIIFFLLYVAIGCIALFQVFIHIPT